MKITTQDEQAIQLISKAFVKMVRKVRKLKAHQPLSQADRLRVKKAIKQAFLKWKKQQDNR